jgi:hypothetical protein
MGTQTHFRITPTGRKLGYGCGGRGTGLVGVGICGGGVGDAAGEGRDWRGENP